MSTDYISMTCLCAATIERVAVRAPCPIGRPVWTGNNYDITVGVAHPALPVIGAAVTVRRVSMPGQNDLDSHFRGSQQDFIEIFDLEPQQDAVSIRFVVAISNRAVMMVNLEAVELKNKLAIRG